LVPLKKRIIRGLAKILALINKGRGILLSRNFTIPI